MAFSHFNTISTKLIVNPDPMTQGLKSGEDKVTQFANNIKQNLDSLGGSFGALGHLNPFGAMIDNAEGLIGKISKLGSMLGSGGLFGAAVGAGAVGLFHHITEAADDANDKALQLEKQAKRIGVDRADIAAFNVLVGPDKAQDLAQALFKMNRMIGDAQEGGEAARKVFDKLGLSLEEVGAMSNIERIEAITKAIFASGDAATQANLAIDVLGKGAANNFGALRKIAEGGLGGAREFAMGAGFVASPEQIERAKHAEKLKWQKLAIEAGAENRQSDATADMQKFAHKMEEFSMTTDRDANLRTWYYSVLNSPFKLWKGFWNLESDANIAMGFQELRPHNADAARAWKVVEAMNRKGVEGRQAADALYELDQLDAQFRASEKAKEYSFRGNAADLGPSRGDLGAALSFSLMEREKRLGLSAFAPITSLLAGGADLTSFSGQQEIQRLAATVGGQKKTEEERIIAVNEKELKEAEENNRFNQRMVELLEQGVSLTPGGAF